MADGGKVIIKIDGDNNGFKNAMGGIGKISDAAFKGIAIGAGAAATAIGAIGTAAVKSYAEYEQLVGGVETLFKDSAKILENYANEAYKTAGMSANEYMSTVTNFSASLLKSLGGDTKKAAEYGNQAVIDMSDNANKMGTSIEMIQDAYQGFAKQNYTMLDNLKLGYGGTKTEMERLLKDAEKISGIKFNIDSFADVTQAIHVIQTEMGITGTTSREAATTIEGSAKMMKSAWKNMLTGIADPTQDFDKLLGNLIESIKIYAGNILPAFQNALSGVGNLIQKSIVYAFQNVDQIIIQTKNTIITFINSITSALPIFQPLGDILSYVITNFKSLTIAVTSAAVAFKTMMIIQSIVAAYKAAVPAIAAYTIATQTSQHVSLLLATTLKPMELLFGVLTGKIELQTVATLALAAAKKLLTGGMGLLVAGITAATVAIGVYLASQNNVKSSTEELIEQAEKRIETLESEKEAYEELKTSQIEQAAADLAQVAQTQALYNELKILADETGRVDEANQKRAQFILGELNSAYGTEYTLIDGVIKGYQDMQTEIDNLIAKKKYEIVQKAALPLYEKAITEEIEKRTEAEKDAIAVAEQQEKVTEAYNEVLEKRKKLEEEIEKNSGGILGGNVGAVAASATAVKAYEEEKEALEKLEKAHKKSSAAVIQAQQDKLNYQKATTLASEGLYNEAIGKLSIYTGEYAKKMSEANGDIEKQRKIAEEEFVLAQGALQTYLDNVAAGIEEYDAATLTQLLTYAQEVEKSCKEIGANIGEGLKIGLNLKESSVLKKAQNIVDSIKKIFTGVTGFNIHSPSKWSEEVFAYVIDGGVNGLEKRKNKLINKVSEIVKDTRSEVQKVEDSYNEVMLDSEKHYLEEKERIEREKEEAEYQEKLKNAKNAEEQEKIKQDRLDKIAEEGQKKYLESLKDAADKEREIYEALQKDIEDSKKQIIDNFTEMTESAFDSIEELENAQKSYSDKLKSYGSLYRTYNLPTIKLKNGEQITPERTELADLKKQNQVLKDYADALQAVKKKGNVPKEFFTILRDMSVEEGSEFAKTLLSASQEDFDAYIKDWETNQKLAEDLSKEMFADEAKDLKTEIISTFDMAASEFFEVGEDSAKEFGEGFVEELKNMFTNVRTELNAYLGSITPSLAIAGMGNGTAFSSSNSYSPTYNIYGPYDQSTREQIKAENTKTKLQWLRGGYKS